MKTKTQRLKWIAAAYGYRTSMNGKAVECINRQCTITFEGNGREGWKVYGDCEIEAPAEFNLLILGKKYFVAKGVNIARVCYEEVKTILAWN